MMSINKFSDILISMTKKIIFFLLLNSFSINAQMIWNNPKLNDDVQTLEQLLRKNLPDVYDKLSVKDQDKLKIHYREINKNIKDFDKISTNEYFNFRLPEWLSASGKIKNTDPSPTLASPPTVAPTLEVLAEENTQVNPQPESKLAPKNRRSFYKILKENNFQVGIGFQSSFYDEFFQDRRVETIKSDAVNLKTRAQISLNESNNVTYVPQLSLALSSGSYSLPLEFHLKNFLIVTKWMKWNTSPLFGVGFGNSGHLYVDESSRVKSSDNKYGKVFLGGVNHFEKFNRSWNIAVAANYTPYFQVSKIGLNEKDLTGPGYYLALGTSFLQFFNLELAFEYDKFSNQKIKLEYSSFSTNILYKF